MLLCTVIFSLLLTIFARNGNEVQYNGESAAQAYAQAMETMVGTSKNSEKPMNAHPDLAGTIFSSVFGDHAILQRSPAISAVYGTVAGSVSIEKTHVVVTVIDMASNSYKVNATLMHIDEKSGNATWKAFLKPTVAYIDDSSTPGSRISISVQCFGCSNTTSNSIHDILFGDVWFCSGQSNMWLPMQFTFNRNETFAALGTGKYKNIRTLQMPQRKLQDRNHIQKWILSEYEAVHGSGFAYRAGWERPTKDSVNYFSAACWYFAQELTDSMLARDQSPIPLGLIGSYWGGTMMQMWISNDTLNHSGCRNATGGVVYQRSDISNGALYNGMVCPFLNMSIKGSLWYQGENNVFECQNPKKKKKKRNHDILETLRLLDSPVPGTVEEDAYACGGPDPHMGYGCLTINMIASWRKAWSLNMGMNQNFPFGLVSLAGGTSEGNSNTMGAFRRSQVAGYLIAPNHAMPHTFVAQGFDAGEPWGGPTAKCARSYGPDAPFACRAGLAPHTNMFMGGIHPRPKRVIGHRLASAARALVYNQEDVLWTGPVITGCKINITNHPPFPGNVWIDITFNASLLRKAHDAVLAWHPGNSFTPSNNWVFDPWYADNTYNSPMEVQYNNKTWVGVQILATSDRVKQDPSKLHLPVGYNIVTINTAYGSSTTAANITGLRWAWGDNPCCPRMQRDVVPCPPNSCTIGTVNSTLPAVPFIAKIINGACQCLPPSKC